MKTKILLAALLASASPVMAQDTLTSNSDSNSGAVSGSASGASSDNFNVNAGGNNAGIGNSTSASDSFSGAVSGSSSESNGNQQGQSQSATSDQGQSQGQSANNTQGQTATGGSNTANQTTGQMALNEQGVTVNQQWNSNQLKHTRQEFRTNAAVPLAASSSFSSDYCGGTASGGVSAAPIGISIGGAGPTFDKSCQNLRRAEKFGMAAANWHNLGYDDRAVAMMQMMEWSICNSDSRGFKADYEVVQACNAVLGSVPSAPTPSVQYNDVTPLETQKPNVQPLPEPERYKTPRGEMEFKSNPIIQGENKVTAMATSSPRP